MLATGSIIGPVRIKSWLRGRSKSRNFASGAKSIQLIKRRRNKD